MLPVNLRSIKLFTCPSCNCTFTSRDVPRMQAPKYPIIINCGHSICEFCLKLTLKNSKQITCNICRKCETYTDEQISKLLPDVYALGVITANLKTVNSNFKVRFVSTNPNDSHAAKKQDDTLVYCETCTSKEATFRCDKCEENFCNVCFDSVHKKRGNKFLSHVGVPVYSHPYSSVVQAGCSEHENKAIEFYCDTDNQLICSLCSVTGSHKLHNIVTLVSKNASCTGDLRLEKENGAQVLRRLKFTEQKIRELIPSQKVENSHWIKEIHDHFHDLHTALLVRENELVSEVMALSQANVNHLEKLRQEVSDSSKDLRAILKDTEHAIENPALPICAPALLEKLTDAESIPCHLISPVPSNTLNKDILNLEFDPDFKDVISQYGKVNSKIDIEFCLKSDNTLPPEFVVEPLPPDAFKTDIESVASDTQSESSQPCNNLIDKSHLSLVPLKVEHYIASKQERVNVTYIKDPNHFYVLRCAESAKLSGVMEKVNKWCKSPKAAQEVPTKIIQGDLYLVIYSEDSKWYRGRITKIIPLNKGSGDSENAVLNGVVDTKELDVDPKDAEEQMVEVFYIDFGNSQIVPVSKLRNMQSKFLTLPGVTKQCSLHDIVPVTGKWSLDAIKTFMTFVDKRPVNMMIIEERGNILYVDLSQAASSDITYDTPVSVRDALVFLEHGCFKVGTKAKKEKPSKRSRTFQPSDVLRTNTKCIVIVSHVESPFLFYIQQFASSRHLSDLIFEMAKAYEEETDNLNAIFVPYVGMMCAAKCKKDNGWYRALIVKLPGGAQVEVQYVDFGNREILHYSSIRKLMDRFTKLNVQANECRLADVNPKVETWTEEATEWFKNQVEKKNLTLLSLGTVQNRRVMKSVLYEIENEKELCINSMMVAANFALCTGAYSSKSHLEKSPTKVKPKSILKPQMSINNFKPSDFSIDPPTAPTPEPNPNNAPVYIVPPTVQKKEPDNYAEVIVSYIESPGQFYIRIAGSVEERYKKLATALQEVYVDFDTLPPNITEKDSYAVYREKDSTWYRGYVQHKESDDVYQVRFVDVGFTERVECKNFRVLLQQYGSEESFAVQCHLANVLPAGDSNKWSRIAIDTFRELVGPHPTLYLIAEGEIENGSLPSDLHVKRFIQGGALEPSRLIYESIKEVLINNGVALRNRKCTISPPKSITSHIQTSLTTNNFPPVIASPTPSTDFKNQEALEAQISSLQMCALKPPVPRFPSFQWKKSVLPSSDNFKGKASHVGEDGSIYIQLQPQNAGTTKIDIITQTLQLKFAHTQPEKLMIPPPVGEAVAARFPIDNKWYRAEIISDDPNKIKVFFVDFGNCEIVTLDDICVDILMKDMPCQALQCYLHDIRPASGSMYKPEVLDFLHSTVVDQICLVDVKVKPKEGECLQVELYVQELEIFLSNLLREMGHAISVSEYNQKMAKEYKRDMDEKIPLTSYKSTQLKLPSPIRVCATNLLPQGLVCLQCLKVEDPTTKEEKDHNLEVDEFLKLVEELELKAKDFPIVTNPKEGLACCAQYSYDNSWYRSEVLKVTSKGIEVFYVDYGNSEIVTMDRLRVPEAKFLEFPSQVHFCKIRGLQLEKIGWSPECMQSFMKKLFDSSRELFASVVGQGKIPEVDLLIKTPAGEMQLVYQDLVDKGLVDAL